MCVVRHLVHKFAHMQTFKNSFQPAKQGTRDFQFISNIGNCLADDLNRFHHSMWKRVGDNALSRHCVRNMGTLPQVTSCAPDCVLDEAAKDLVYITF